MNNRAAFLEWLLVAILTAVLAVCILQPLYKEMQENWREVQFQLNKERD